MPLNIYDVTIDGTHTTMKLTDEEAERIGATRVKKRTAPNKARTADSTQAKDHDVSHVCEDCGFEAKTAAGLGSHARSHEDD